MANQDSRIRIKRSTTTGEVPTVAPSTDHSDGTWNATDVYVGEMFLNTADSKLWVRTDGGIKEVAIGGLTVFYKKLTLTPTQVKASNTTPIAFGLTVPTGHYVRLISADQLIDYATTPYATEDVLEIWANGATIKMAQTSLLFATSDTIGIFEPAVGAAAYIQFVAGADLYIKAQSTDPTAGDSPVTIYITYALIPI